MTTEQFNREVDATIAYYIREGERASEPPAVGSPEYIARKSAVLEQRLREAFVNFVEYGGICGALEAIGRQLEEDGCVDAASIVFAASQQVTE